MSECRIMLSCEMCEGNQGCKLDKGVHQRWLVAERMSFIKYKIIVGSNKGGVGKSTITTNLANVLARMGFSVGIADADLHGPNIPKMLGIEGARLKSVEDGIAPHVSPGGIKVASLSLFVDDPNTPIVWRDAVKYEFIIELLGNISWGKLDFLLIDLPPGTGNEQITILDFIGNVDGAVIVTTPQDVALLDARKMINFVRERNVPIIGIVENMSGLACPHCGGEVHVFKKGGGERLAAELGVPFIGRIPLDPEITSSSDEGVPVTTSHPESLPAKAFAEVAENCAEFLMTGFWMRGAEKVRWA